MCVEVKTATFSKEKDKGTMTISLNKTLYFQISNFLTAHNQRTRILAAK